MRSFAIKEILSAYEEMDAINTNLKIEKGHYKIIIIIIIVIIIIIIPSFPGRRCS
jgi:hypothetical protein